MTFLWLDTAKAELRAIDREAAVRILHALTRFAETGDGDVKALTGDWQAHSRLRVGDYRVVFRATPDQIVVVRVRHRSEVYRQH